jgi:uncharacterized protein (TIGR02996 family)
MTEREALTRAICAHPDDDTPRLVFADWLQEHGDEPRAEFIRIQIELARPTSAAARPPLYRRESELLDRHEERWMRPLNPFLFEWSDEPYTFRRGFVDVMELREETLWNDGIELCRLTPLTIAVFPQVVDWELLGGCECLRQIPVLDLTGSDLDADSGVARLFKSEHIGKLRELWLVGEDPARPLDESGLVALTDCKGLGSLRALDLGFNPLGPDAVEILAAAPFAPHLETLRLEGVEIGDEGVDWLAELNPFPRLKHLNLADNRIGDRGVRRIIATPWMWNLESLHLSRNYRVGTGDGDVRPETLYWLWERFGDRVK